MTINVPISIIILAVVVALVWGFFIIPYKSGYDRYGIEGLFRFLGAIITTLFCISVFFAGAYFQWWNL